jgi:hypothetical protein
MSRASHALIGTWRIIEADLWDRDYLDLAGPACISFGKDGRGEFIFGAVHGDMELDYLPGAVSFTWAGFDETDDVSGAGSARLGDNGTLAIELSFHLGDNAVLKARRQWLLQQPARSSKPKLSLSRT